MNVPAVDPRLQEIAEHLERTQWAALICDQEWRLVWTSSELNSLLGESDGEKIGYGKHLLEAYLSPPWFDTVTDETRMAFFNFVVSRMVVDTPGGLEGLKNLAPEPFGDIVEQLEPVDPEALWSAQIQFIFRDLPPTQVNYVSIRLVERSGEYLGNALIYGSALPATLLNLVTRGDARAFARMARLFDPGRRSAGILFADLQLSGTLSRRLPSAAYFNLIRALLTKIDSIVLDEGGVVGKHAGDGVTAYFLADDLGSPSAAARACIEAAKKIPLAARHLTDELGEELLRKEECLVNVGIHYSDTLFMGQLVTGGRLEVTALGDAVNECARIQQTARNGRILASKVLVEQVVQGDAAGLEIDPDAVLYQTLAELPDCTEKAARDAGGLPVTPL